MVQKTGDDPGDDLQELSRKMQQLVPEKNKKRKLVV